MTRVGRRVFASLLSLSFGASCPLPAKQILLLPHAGDCILWRPSGDGQPLLVPNPGGAGCRAEGRRSVLPLLLLLKAGCVASCLSREHIPLRDPGMSGFAPMEVTFLAEGLRSTRTSVPHPRQSQAPWPALARWGAAPLLPPQPRCLGICVMWGTGQGP